MNNSVTATMSPTAAGVPSPLMAGSPAAGAVPSPTPPVASTQQNQQQQQQQSNNGNMVNRISHPARVASRKAAYKAFSRNEKIARLATHTSCKVHGYIYALSMQLNYDLDISRTASLIIFSLY